MSDQRAKTPFFIFNCKDVKAKQLDMIFFFKQKAEEIHYMDYFAPHNTTEFMQKKGR